MLTGESKVNISEDGRQHSHIQATMPYQDDALIWVSAIAHQSLYEGDEPFLNLMKAFSAGHLAIELLKDEPIIVVR